MRIGSVLFLFMLVFHSEAQNMSMNDRITENIFREHKTPAPAKRKILSFSKSARYNPLAYLGAGLLFFYQNVISEQFQAECIYKTSCSEYTKQSVQRHGFIRGVLSGFNQLSECHRGALLEHPAVSIDQEHKIINPLD